LFVELAGTLRDYAGLDYKALGATGRALTLDDNEPAIKEARA